MIKTPDVRQLSNADLKRIHEGAREALTTGEPLPPAVRRFGIRDLGTLKRWLHRVEAEMDRRKLGFERASS
jgi:hypothetical protein